MSTTNNRQKWTVIETPCWPNRYKVVNPTFRDDNSFINYFPTRTTADAEAKRRNEELSRG